MVRLFRTSSPETKVLSCQVDLWVERTVTPRAPILLDNSHTPCRTPPEAGTPTYGVGLSLNVELDGQVEMWTLKVGWGGGDRRADLCEGGCTDP